MIFINPKSASHNYCRLLVILKVIFANSVDPDQTAPLEQSDQGPHCLPVCKNRFEKSTRIFSRRHKQTTFSDAVFIGALRVKNVLARRFQKYDKYHNMFSMSKKISTFHLKKVH